MPSRSQSSMRFLCDIRPGGNFRRSTILSSPAKFFASSEIVRRKTPLFCKAAIRSRTWIPPAHQTASTAGTPSTVCQRVSVRWPNAVKGNPPNSTSKALVVPAGGGIESGRSFFSSALGGILCVEEQIGESGAEIGAIGLNDHLRPPAAQDEIFPAVKKR